MVILLIPVPGVAGKFIRPLTRSRWRVKHAGLGDVAGLLCGHRAKVKKPR
jgi:hypothetical protein